MFFHISLNETIIFTLKFVSLQVKNEVIVKPDEEKIVGSLEMTVGLNAEDRRVIWKNRL